MTGTSSNIARPRFSDAVTPFGRRGGGPPRDRESAGTLSVQIPVPAAGAAERQTPWVRWARAWSWLWILGPSLLLAFGRRKQAGA